MQEFRIKPEAYARLRKKGLLFYGLIALLTIATSSFLGLFNSEMTITDVMPVLIGIGIVLVFIGFSTYRGMKKQKEFLENYRLTIEDNVITRQQPNTEELTIYFHEIKEITRYKKGALVIKGFDKTDIIYVPSQLTRYEELVALLSEVKPITPLQGAASVRQKLLLLASLVFIGLFITLYVSTNKVLIAISGILVSAGLVWFIMEIRTNKNVSYDAKKRWWMYVLLLVIIIGMTCYKLFSRES